MSKTIYIQNKYLNWYNSIISKALSESRFKGTTYYENHHILPKSLGGSNSLENFVLLTAREHYICHYLLTKFTTNKHKQKMHLAFFCMNTLNSNYKNS